MEDWGPQEVESWFHTLHPDVQRHSGALLPAAGCAVVHEWDQRYLTSKGLSEQDARRLLIYREKVRARAVGAFPTPGAAEGSTGPAPLPQGPTAHAVAPAMDVDRRRPGDTTSGLLPLLASGVHVACAALEKLGPSLPFPGGEVANLVLQVLAGVEGALANSANLRQLRDRAVALLDVLVAYAEDLERARKYKAVVDDFREVLQHIVAYAQAYGSRSCVMRMLTVGRDAEECEALVAELRAVYERVMLAVAVDGNALLQEATGLLRQAAAVQDPGASLRALVSALGGMEAVKADPAKMALVMEKLDVAAQVTIEAVSLLLESHLDKGPQRHIKQAELRLFWKKLYASLVEVPWFAWWEDFPSRFLEGVPDVDPAQAEELQRLLAGAPARAAFEQALERSNPETVSVWEVRIFCGEEALVPQVSRLVSAAATNAGPGSSDGAPASSLQPTPAASVRCQLPPLPAHYTGREEEAEGLAEHLRARGSLVLLAGGGMGKSCLAADVGWRLVRGGQAGGGVLWVDLREAFSGTDVEARFCVALDLPMEKEDNAPRIVAAVRGLAGPQQEAAAGGCPPVPPPPLAAVVVVDNAEDALGQAEAAEALQRLVAKILAEAPAARLLVTSRASLHLPSPAPPLLSERPVGAIGLPAATRLVQAVAEDVGEAEAREVAEACQCVPLVLGLVAEALVAGRMTLEDLPRLTAAAANPTSVPSAASTVALVRLVLAGLKRQHQRAAARLAVFPSSFHEDAAAAILNLPTTSGARGLLEVLLRHSVVAREGLQRYSLHPVVRQQAALVGAGLDAGLQAATEGRFIALMLRRLAEWADMYRAAKEWRLALAAAREQQADVGKVLELLAKLYTSGGASHAEQPPVAVAAALTDNLRRLLTGLGLLQRLLPLCEALLQGFAGPRPDGVEQGALDRAVASVLCMLAWIQYRAGRYAEAEEHARRCHQLRISSLGLDSAEAASSINVLAVCIKVQGRFAEAEPLYRQALELRRRVLGEEHPDMVDSLNNLANCVYDQGRFAEAEPLYRQALGLCERVLGEEHPDAAGTLGNLASCISDQGRFAEAEPLYWQALELRRRMLGKEHPDTAGALSNLANCVKAQGRSSEAAPLYRQALELRQRVLGQEHPDTAQSLNNLGVCMTSQGRFAEAEVLYRQALELRQRVLGQEHPDTASSLGNLANCINSQGRFAEAEPLYWQALELRRRVLGEEHPDTAGSVGNLASCIDDQGRFSEAEPLYRQVLELRQRVLGQEHPDTAQSLNNLGVCITAQGRFAEAEPLYRQALELRQRVLGEEHPDTASSLGNLANLIDDQGRHSEAEPLYRQALELRRRVLGEEHPDTANALNNLAVCINEQGRHSEAEPLYRQALELRQRVLGEDHPDTASSLGNLAILIDDQGRHSEAETLHRQVLELRRRVLGEEHPDTATALNNLAVCIEDQDRRSEAEPLYRQALELRQRVLGQEHPDIAEALNNLGECIDKQGRHPEAEPLFRQALEVGVAALGKDHDDTTTYLNNLGACLKSQGRSFDPDRELAELQ